jgi:sortase A
MTALDARPDRAAETADAPAAATTRSERDARRIATRRVTRIALAALAVMIGAWAVFALFEGPVAQSWYTNRQHDLASRFAKGGLGHAAGDPVAILQIPTLGTNLIVANGDSAQQLRSGPIHRLGTPMPGEVGNSVIVGHRSAWGKPFAGVQTLKPGSFIVVQTRGSDGLPHNAVFTVVSTATVGANDLAPLAPSTDRRLTIVTGAGGDYSDRRLVISAVSGTPGRVLPATPLTDATISTGSSLFNADVLLALVCLAGAGILGFVLRRRGYHPGAVACVVVPLSLVAVLGLLLAVDTALPPIR